MESCSSQTPPRHHNNVMHNMPVVRCALFCRVIDNYGDLGVCLRLAKQMTTEYNIQVTLWVDDLVTLKQLAPSIDASLTEQDFQQIHICQWQHTAPFMANTWHLLIEGFSCHLPPELLPHMAAQQPVPPLWLCLDYLSTEPWAETCHLRPSIHPSTGLTQYFYFPGFTANSGGLLREQSLTAFSARCVAQLKEKYSIDTRPYSHVLSLFSYPSESIHHLLSACSQLPYKVLLLIPLNKAMDSVHTWKNSDVFDAQGLMQIGSLTLQRLPFLSSNDYDTLLALCDVNIVRGEDSLIRAHWAGKPFIWHIYPQDEQAHMLKLTAFIQQLDSAVSVPASYKQRLIAWNTATAIDWQATLAALPTWQIMQRQWRQHLLTQADLCQQLMRFYAER